MSPLVLEGTWERGTFRPAEPVDLPEGIRVRLAVTPVGHEHDPLNAVIGICKSGPIDGAEKHDEYIYGGLQ